MIGERNRLNSQLHFLLSLRQTSASGVIITKSIDCLLRLRWWRDQHDRRRQLIARSTGKRRHWLNGVERLNEGSHRQHWTPLYIRFLSIKVSCVSWLQGTTKNCKQLLETSSNDHPAYWAHKRGPHSFIDARLFNQVFVFICAF